MSLTQELNNMREQASKTLPADKWKVMIASTDRLVEDHLSGQALKVGDKMVDFELPNVKNEKVSLAEHLAKGPVVLSFYRGGWCPYCNVELKALQDILPQLKDKGATLIAVSPETPDNSLSTSEKNELAFPVLSDIDNVVAKKIGLVFQMPEELREIYHSFGLDVSKHNGNQEYELPMPATYVIDSEGKITYAFVQEDYTQRADPEEVLKAL